MSQASYNPDLISKLLGENGPKGAIEGIRDFAQLIAEDHYPEVDVSTYTKQMYSRLASNLTITIRNMSRYVVQELDGCPGCWMEKQDTAESEVGGMKQLTSTSDRIMTTEHPKWKQFTEELSAYIQENGCDSQTLRGAEHVLSQDKWGDGLNVEESLEYFREHGGFCDCEILMNVDPGFWEQMETEEGAE